jgi:ABC-type nitrate/sulfonate/bicarbonate transport system permease component
MKTRFANTALPVALLVILGLSWEASVHFFEIPSYILPGPWAILKVMWQRMDLLVAHGVVTLIEIGLGFWLALVVGLTLAVLIHSSRIIERSFLPLIISSQTIPVFAIAPLLILWFGYGIGSKVVMTAIIVFFPIVVNTVEGLKAADPDTLALLKILEASPGQVFFKVRVPQSLPFVFTGIKIGVAVSVIGAVIGEWVGAREGLGYLMIHANAQLQVDLVFASIFYLSILGMGLYGLVVVVERLLVPRRYGGSST